MTTTIIATAPVPHESNIHTTDTAELTAPVERVNPYDFADDAQQRTYWQGFYAGQDAADSDEYHEGYIAGCVAAAKVLAHPDRDGLAARIARRISKDPSQALLDFLQRVPTMTDTEIAKRFGSPATNVDVLRSIVIRMLAPAVDEEGEK